MVSYPVSVSLISPVAVRHELEVSSSGTVTDFGVVFYLDTSAYDGLPGIEVAWHPL